MNRLMLAGLLAGLCAAPVRAAATYDATVGARYVDLDSKWNKSQAMEFDGKRYNVPHGDVSVGNQGELGLFDFSLKDIGSKEEVLNFNLDYKSTFKASAKWSALHHRMNPLRHGQVVNGVWRPNNIALTTGADRFTYRNIPPVDFSADPNAFDYRLRRTESEVNLGLFSPANSARWITLQYWGVNKTGSRIVQTSQSGASVVGEANVDNTQTDLTLGLGTDITEKAAVAIDLGHSSYEDNAAHVGTTATSVIPILPKWPRHQMTSAETRWRYDASKKLSMTAALTGRQRENLSNLYKFNAGVAALNAAYRASNKLSLTAKTYFRYFEIDENIGFRGFHTSAPAGNSHEFDKLTARGEMIASYRPVEMLRTKASYKVELNHRRDAPSEEFTRSVLYEDNFRVPANWGANNLSNQDLKHILKLVAAVHLPLDAELEGEYTKLYANRPAFINMPTRKDEVGAHLALPLPAHVEFSLGGNYSKERNADEATNYHLSRNAYRAGLNWEKNHKMFFGTDATYEVIRYNTNQYYQANNNPNNIPDTVNLPYEEGALQRQRNTTLGVNGRVVCPKGFVVLGNGSYTWSVVQNPVNFGWTPAQAATLAASQVTPGGTFVNDIMPSETRIARGTLGFEYTPEKFPSLTARASYTVTDWVDKVDSYNSGRASVAQVGASMKF